MLMLLCLVLALAQDPAPPTGGSSEPTEMVSSRGLFDTGRATLTSQGVELAQEWARVIQAQPEASFEIGVHTDSQGSSAFNGTLSQRRAFAIQKAMMDAGVAKERLKAVGYGEDRPIAPNTTAEGRARNSRIELMKMGGAARQEATGAARRLPPPVPPPVSAPKQVWHGYSPALRGELGSGDERREGKEQVDTTSFEVPFTAPFALRYFHGRDNQPTARLVSPTGEGMNLPSGGSSRILTRGSWTLEVRDAKKAAGIWGLELKGVSSSEPPIGSAGACEVLDYLIAQSHVGMKDARGAKIDGNFSQAPALPGLPGEGRLHRRGEYWLDLYEGPDPAMASRAWTRARAVVSGCLEGWTPQESGWMKRTPRSGGPGFSEREVDFTQRQDDQTVLVQIEEEHHQGEAHARLYLYQKSR